MLRAWLERNRVFFETATATFLAVMALVLSWSTVKEGRRQTEVQLLSLLPDFRLQQQVARDSAVGSTAYLFVTNIGHRVDVSDVEVAPFVKADCYYSGRRVQVDTFPVRFYGGRSLTGAQEGLVALFSGVPGNVTALDHTPVLGEAGAELRELVAVSYTDLSGRSEKRLWLRNAGSATALTSAAADSIRWALEDQLPIELSELDDTLRVWCDEAVFREFGVRLESR